MQKKRIIDFRRIFISEVLIAGSRFRNLMWNTDTVNFQKYFLLKLLYRPVEKFFYRCNLSQQRWTRQAHKIFFFWISFYLL